MLLSDFDFELPPELIARRPMPERTSSRLLVVDASDGAFADRQFAELPEILRAGDLLVLNDTRVIKARLRGAKVTGGAVELLIERIVAETRALVHLRASKSPKPGSDIQLPNGRKAAVRGRAGRLYELEFSHPVEDVLAESGEVPLPPYLKRPPENADQERYQTVYARQPGAVAAPTAGLHFDQSMLDRLSAAGVEYCFVTLHVGAGTFQNLEEPVVADNRLHSERIELSSAVCERICAARAAGRRIVAVGTTSARVLEAACASGELAPISGETDLFIHPGYAFRAVDVLLTNFHLPKSSLLMMVCALAGRDLMLAAYRHAVASRYRFFSYGDAMLIFAPDADG